jgi:hypothetical protein
MQFFSPHLFHCSYSTIEVPPKSTEKFESSEKKWKIFPCRRNPPLEGGLNVKKAVSPAMAAFTVLKSAFSGRKPVFPYQKRFFSTCTAITRGGNARFWRGLMLCAS